MFIQIKRISDGFYSYVVKLYDNDKNLIDEEICGELVYWGRGDQYRECRDAVRELLERNGINDVDVEVFECGGFFQDECPEIGEKNGA
ncbi:MAG: hypothetical protein QXS37_06105 [Candidatus Aenigmatarchaeota archaeon]